MAVLIESARMQDLDALLKLESEAFSAADWMLSRRAFRYHLLSNNLLLVARQSRNDPTPIAYILVLKRKKTARIYSLAVSPAFRRQGIASQLFKEALDDCIASQLYKVRLEVRASNHKAISLYKALGFQEHAVCPDYYQDHEDACRMEWRYDSSLFH